MPLETTPLPKNELDATQFVDWITVGKLAFPGIQLDAGIEGLSSSDKVRVNVILQGNNQEKMTTLARLLEARVKKYNGVLEGDIDVIPNDARETYRQLVGQEIEKLPQYFCELDFVFDQKFLQTPRSPQPLKSLPLAQ